MPQQDFNTAERQAIMRAQEMYRRATRPQENSEPVFHKQQSAPPNDFRQQPPPPKQNYRPEPKRETQKPFFGNIFGNLFDGDMKLIIAMLLLLSGDGGDTMLLLALIYIMI